MAMSMSVSGLGGFDSAGGVVAHLELEREAVIAISLALLRVLSEAFDRNANGTEDDTHMSEMSD